MSIEDEIYFETHEFELLEMYHDYLTENELTEDEFTLSDFRDTF